MNEEIILNKRIILEESTQENHTDRVQVEDKLLNENYYYGTSGEDVIVQFKNEDSKMKGVMGTCGGANAVGIPREGNNPALFTQDKKS